MSATATAPTVTELDAEYVKSTARPLTREGQTLNFIRDITKKGKSPGQEFVHPDYQVHSVEQLAGYMGAVWHKQTVCRAINQECMSIVRSNLDTDTGVIDWTSVYEQLVSLQTIRVTIKMIDEMLAKLLDSQQELMQAAEANPGDQMKFFGKAMAINKDIAKLRKLKDSKRRSSDDADDDES